jgi:hypothetical protein
MEKKHVEGLRDIIHPESRSKSLCAKIANRLSASIVSMTV